jgi:hypothetical protein
VGPVGTFLFDFPTKNLILYDHAGNKAPCGLELESETVCFGEDEIDIAAEEAAMKRAEERLGKVSTEDAEEASRLQAAIATNAARLEFKRKRK